MRRKVKEVTLDMASNMELIVGRCFPQAAMVTDRFHVEKLVAEALQHMRIEHRWEAIEQENKEIELAWILNWLKVKFCIEVPSGWKSATKQ